MYFNKTKDDHVRSHVFNNMMDKENVYDNWMGIEVVVIEVRDTKYVYWIVINWKHLVQYWTFSAEMTLQ